MSGKADIDGLQKFIESHNFTKYSYHFSAQDWHDPNIPVRMEMAFDNIEFSDAAKLIRFQGKNSLMCLQSPQEVSFIYDEAFRTGEITILLQYPTKAGRRTRRFLFQAS